MDTKANIKELICNAHKASFEAYNFPDPNNVTHFDFYNWAESDANVDVFDTGIWFFTMGAGQKFLTQPIKEAALNYLQTIADANNIPFYASLALQEYSDTQIQNMVVSIFRTLKDRNIDIKQDYINVFRSAT